MECPVLQLNKEQFNRPFSEFWTEYFREHPDTAMIKIIPPKGWMPRKGPFHNLDRINIDCPTKQVVVGSKGHYIVLLIEQKPCTVADFKKMTLSSEHRPPKLKDDEDEKRERQFWKSVTINPPYYGADTPQSFFDPDLSQGWNMRNLGCLLKQDFIPTIEGVSTPMTYFGMWKSFFAWHKEDADLYSMNYLHFGAPKVWYCIPPSEMAKFEQMSQSLYPELARQCPQFLRHKEVLVSPSILKTHGIKYYATTQKPNEFIVLNAAAYHSGYNLGFNCAEAVNFALVDWIPIGLKASRCRCGLMKDGVRFDMELFLNQYPQYRPPIACDGDQHSQKGRNNSGSRRKSSKSRLSLANPEFKVSHTLDQSPSKSDQRSLLSIAQEYYSSSQQSALSNVHIQQLSEISEQNCFGILTQQVQTPVQHDVQIKLSRLFQRRNSSIFRR